MKLTIIAATGAVGRQLLTQAEQAGHDVTVVVRNPARLPAGTTARVITTDLARPDPAALTPAIDGADAVLSCLGPNSNAEAGINAPATRAITTAMRGSGVRRIVVISAAPVGTVASPGRPNPPRHDPGDGFFMRHIGAPLIKRFIPKVYTDLALMEDVLRDSGLDWTAVRPPKLTNKPLTGTYRTARGRNVKGGAYVSRADVAHCMLTVLTQPDSIGQTIGIAA